MGRLRSIFVYDTTPAASLVMCRLCVSWRYLAATKDGATEAAAEHEERCHPREARQARDTLAKRHARASA